jgi:hypothetical protein
MNLYFSFFCMIIQYVKENAKIAAPISGGQSAACMPVSIVSCPDVPWLTVKICTTSDTRTVISPAIHNAAGAYAEKIFAGAAVAASGAGAVVLIYQTLGKFMGVSM